MTDCISTEQKMVKQKHVVNVIENMAEITQKLVPSKERGIYIDTLELLVEYQTILSRDL